MNDLEFALRWLLVLAGALALVRISSRRLFGGYTWPLGLAFFLLVWTYFYWIWGSFLTLPSGRWPHLISAVLAFGVLHGVSRFFPEPAKDEGPSIVSWVVLGLAFVGAVAFTVCVPDLVQTEKFNDMAVFQAASLSDHFPPMDRWLSGYPVNYYYWGHLILGLVATSAGVPPEYAVNLALCTLAAMIPWYAFLWVFGVTRNRRAAGLAAAASILLSNWVWMSGDFFWWTSSRAIPGTITEFPYFTLLVGDLHAHYTSIPFLTLALALGVRLRSIAETSTPRKSQILVLVLACALAVGVHYPMHGWNLPVIALIIALLLGKRWKLTACVGAASWILFAPYWLRYERPVTSLEWLPASLHSPILPFVQHWAPFFAPLVLFSLILAVSRRSIWTNLGLFAVITAFTVWAGPAAGIAVFLAAVSWHAFEGRRGSPVLVLFQVALALIVAVEMVYIKDAYSGDLRRINTVFRMYFLSWWLLSLATPTLFWELRDRLRPRWLWTGVVCAVVGLSLVYPIRATPTRTGAIPKKLTLDGMKFWEREFPGEREAIDWIRTHTPRDAVILEAFGGAYTLHGRVSAFGGRPTVLGWANHEWVWRKQGYAITSPRQTQYDALIRSPSPEALEQFFTEFRVHYAVIGRLEREAYSQGLLALLHAYPLAFSSSGMEVRQVNGGMLK